MTTAVGYSAWCTFILVIITFFLAYIPIGLGLKRLPANITVVGSNSLAISAACHVSALSHAVWKEPMPEFPNSPNPNITLNVDAAIESHRSTGTSYESDPPGNHHRNLSDAALSKQSLISKTASTDDLDSRESTFSRLSRSKLRWGVVQMPNGWYKWNRDISVEHLSFGVEEDGVLPPAPGSWYA